jgi:type II secretory pathway pseudopilin PulG
MKLYFPQYFVADETGNSLLEIVVTLLIFALVSVIAVPHLSQTKASFDRLQAKQQLEYWIERAQSISQSRSVRSLVIFSADGSSLTLGTDEIPYNNPVREDTALFVGELPDNITVETSGNLVFDSRGFLVNESGGLSQSKIALNYAGENFCTAVVYPLGKLEYHC